VTGTADTSLAPDEKPGRKWPQKWWPETEGKNLREEKIPGQQRQVNSIGPMHKSHGGAGK